MNNKQMLVSFFALIFIQSIITTASWNYSNGGDSWKLINDYPDCKATSQSPINIVRKHLNIDIISRNLKSEYKTGKNLNIKNTGHTQKVSGESTLDWGNVTYRDKKYNVGQLHMHQPSEHTFDGYRYDMELHIVHQEANGEKDYLVFAVYFNIGGESEFLKSIKYTTVSSTTDSSVILDEGINIWTLLKKAKGMDYISYEGSFTTPPCTEGVKFF